MKRVSGRNETPRILICLKQRRRPVAEPGTRRSHMEAIAPTQTLLWNNRSQPPLLEDVKFRHATINRGQTRYPGEARQSEFWMSYSTHTWKVLGADRFLGDLKSKCEITITHSQYNRLTYLIGKLHNIKTEISRAIFRTLQANKGGTRRMPVREVPRKDRITQLSKHRP